MVVLFYLRRFSIKFTQFSWFATIAMYQAGLDERCWNLQMQNVVGSWKNKVSVTPRA